MNSTEDRKEEAPWVVRPELQQGKGDPSFLKHPILAHMGTRRRSSFLEMGAACEGAVGVGEEPLEAREPRQCGRARNPSHGKGLRSSLVTDSGESRWSISASSSI